MKEEDRTKLNVAIIRLISLKGRFSNFGVDALIKKEIDNIIDELKSIEYKD